MGRHDDEELPAVEVLGAEPQISSLMEVSTRGPRDPRRRRRTALLLVMAVVGLLTAGVLLGDDSTQTAAEPEEETSSTTDRTTTSRERGSTTTLPSTTTTTTVPTGPLFPGYDIEGWLLSGAGSGWTLVDIPTGSKIDPSLPFDDPYSTRGVRGGVVMLSYGQARYHDLRVPQERREPVDLGPADQILTTVGRDRVWLVQGAYEPDADGPRARLVDLDGRVLQSFALPPGAYSSATPDGVLLERGGRVYLASAAGVQPIAVGNLVGPAGSSVVVFACADDAASCSFELRDRSGRLLRRLPAGPASPDFGWSISSAQDGRFALVTQLPDGTGTDITLLQPDGDTIATVDASGFMVDAIAWLPGDAGLVGSRASRMVWIHDTGHGWSVDNIPSLVSVESLGLLPVLRG